MSSVESASIVDITVLLLDADDLRLQVYVYISLIGKKTEIVLYSSTTQPKYDQHFAPSLVK